MLQPLGGEGTNFVISFNPAEYGKNYTGKLIIETDDMQWTYEVGFFLKRENFANSGFYFVGVFCAGPGSTPAIRGTDSHLLSSLVSHQPRGDADDSKFSAVHFINILFSGGICFGPEKNKELHEGKHPGAQAFQKMTLHYPHTFNRINLTNIGLHCLETK